MNPGVMAYVYNTNLLGYGRVGVEEMRQEDCCEFEASLGHITSSRAVRLIQYDSICIVFSIKEKEGKKNEGDTF